jgi:membrane-associated phospholipid phosphatase
MLTILTVVVAAGLADSLDVATREVFRPDMGWTQDQQRASHVLTWLEPSRMVPALVVGAAAVSAWRLTLWPLVQAGSALALTGVLVLGLKFLLDRSDPKGAHTSLGGSYPSGHSAALLVCVFTGAMLVSCPTRWWQRAGCLLLGTVLAIAMLYDALHWLSDIVAGALVAGVVLGAEALVAGQDGGPNHKGRQHRFRRPGRDPDHPVN